MNAAIGDFIILDVLTQTPVHTLSGSLDSTTVTLPKLNIILLFIGLDFGFQLFKGWKVSPTKKRLAYTVFSNWTSPATSGTLEVDAYPALHPSTYNVIVLGSRSGPGRNDEHTCIQVHTHVTMSAL